MADSTVTVAGNLTGDMELRFTPGGQSIATGNIAVSRRYQVNGEWTEQTSFFKIAVWGKMGENLVQSTSKGTRIIVTGRLEQREYEKKDGTKGSSVEIVAEEAGLSVKWDPAQSMRAEREKPARKQQASDEEPW